MQIQNNYIAFFSTRRSNNSGGAHRKRKFRGWEVEKKGGRGGGGEKKKEKRTISLGAWGYRMAARSGLSLGSIYLTPATTHRKQEMTSRYLSLSLFLAAINASARTCNFEHLLRPYNDQLCLVNSWEIPRCHLSRLANYASARDSIKNVKQWFWLCARIVKTENNRNDCCQCCRFLCCNNKNCLFCRQIRIASARKESKKISVIRFLILDRDICVSNFAHLQQQTNPNCTSSHI